jgi:hypothetical protein
MDCPWIRRTERQRLHAHAPEVVPARSWARFSIRRCHGAVSNLFLCHVNSLAWPMRRRPVSASGAARAAPRLLWSLVRLAERHVHERLARPMRSKLGRAGAAAHWLGKPLFLAWPPLRAWPDRQLPGGWRRHPACHGAHTGLPGTPAPMLPGGAQPARAHEPRSWFKFWMGVNIQIIKLIPCLCTPPSGLLGCFPKTPGTRNRVRYADSHASEKRRIEDEKRHEHGAGEALKEKAW